MATWEEMSRSSLRAAKVLYDAQHYRSSISRCYYAAYCAVTSKLAGKYTFSYGGNNPSHPDLPRFITNNLPAFPEYRRRHIRTTVGRLWGVRVEADYVPTASINGSIALAALRDANSVLELLEVA